MEKINISKKYKKSLNLSPLSKIHNNKMFYLSRNHSNKFNYKSEENSFPKKVNYLKYKHNLFKKCNSQILENKEILPILSNRKKNKMINNISYFNKTPIKAGKIQNQKMSIIIPISSRLNNNNQLNINNFKNINLGKSIKLNSIQNSYIQEKNIKLNNGKDKDLSTSFREKELGTKKSEEIKNNENDENSLSIKNNSKKKGKQSSLNSPIKYSKFYNYSKRRNVSARKIYEYYINEEINQNYTPIDDFTKLIGKKNNSFQNKLNRLYGIDKIFLNNLEELKTNKSLAFKDDFKVQEYQKILLGMLKKRIRPTSLFSLKQNFKKFNEKILRGFESHKGRYSKLADKIRDFAPIHLINKLHELDDEKIKEKAKFLKANIIIKNKGDETYDEFENYLQNKSEADEENN